MWRWLTFFFLFPLCVWSQKPLDGRFAASATLSAAKVSIDDTFEVKLFLTYPETYTVNKDRLRINLLKYIGLSEPPFDLVEETEKKLPNGEHLITFTLEPQLAGKQFISFYDIVFRPKNSERDSPVEVISAIFPVEITLPTTPTHYEGTPPKLLSLTEPYPIAINSQNRDLLLENPEVEQKQAEILRHRMIPWDGIAGGLLFVIVIFIARMQPSRKKSPLKALKKRSATAQQRALEKLVTLEWEPQQSATYYCTLTDAVRNYIEERYLLKATTQTTEEFLETIASSSSFDTPTQSRLADFLKAADLVKFGGQPPPEERCRRAHASAKTFIES